jgi:type I restriction enzyme R subunit
VNDLFEGDLTDDDRLVYVNNVIKGKLLESQELVTQASNNTKAQFANSPTLSKEIMNAVMDALEVHREGLRGKEVDLATVHRKTG